VTETEAAPPAPARLKGDAAPRTRSLNPAAVAAAAPVVDTPVVVPPPAPPVVHVEAPAPHVPAPTRTAALAPNPTHDAAPEPREPRAVATLTVTRQTFKQDTSGYHSCAKGERIITSFYWEGKRTASGEPFEPDRRFAAAHRTLPFGTRLMITNPRTGKSVIVTVNDRGPYARGVTLDLTRSAAQAIGMSGTGAVCMAKL